MSTISSSTTSTTAFGVTADTTGALVIQTGATPTTALTIGSTQAITVASTGNGITYSSSGGSGLRMYGAGGTNQWDVYGNGANIRFSDNTGGGIVVVDTAARIGSTIGVGGTTPSSSGAGITFPVTQSASSNAKTLDDYEEGTWTTTFQGSGVNLSTSSLSSNSTYIKIGKQVTLFGYITTTKTAGTTSLAYIAFTAPFTINTAQTSCAIATGNAGNNVAIVAPYGGTGTTSNIYFLTPVSSAIAAVTDSYMFTFTYQSTS